MYSEASIKNMGITQNKFYLWKAQQLKLTGQVRQKCAVCLIRIHWPPLEESLRGRRHCILSPPYIYDKINGDVLRTMILWMVEKAFRLWENEQEANLQAEWLCSFSILNVNGTLTCQMGKGNAQRWWLFSILIV